MIVFLPCGNLFTMNIMNRVPSLLQRAAMAVLLVAAGVQAADILEFTSRLGTLEPASMLLEEGYCVRGGSPIRGEVGRCDYAIAKDLACQERALTSQFGALGLVTSERGWGILETGRASGGVPCVNTLMPRARNACSPIWSVRNSSWTRAGQPVALFCAAGERNPFQGHPGFNLHFNVQSEPSR
jgi:hypothetical protein